MVSIKKYVPCKCGASNSFEFSSDMGIEDLTISAKCPSCSSSLMISISSLMSNPQQQLAPQAASQTQQLLSEERPSSQSASSSDSQAVHDAQVEENVDTAIREIFKSPF